MTKVKDILEHNELLAKLCCCSEVDTEKYWNDYNDFYNTDVKKIRELDTNELYVVWMENNGT